MALERKNRVAATCASCGGRVAPREGVLESRHGASRAFHADCRGPVFGSAPRPRSRPLIEPLTFSGHRRLVAAIAARRRILLAGALALFALGLTTVVTAGRISEEQGREGAFAIVDYDLPTSTTTAAPSTTMAVADTTTAPPVEVAAAVVTQAPRRAVATPPSTEAARDEPPVTAADVVPGTTLPTVAPTPPTTTPPPPTTTASPTTTAKPDPGERECTEGDRRGKCRADGKPGRA